MSDNIKELEFQKLINEIIFLKEDLKLKETLSSVIEKEFHNELHEIINNDPNLKEQWEATLDTKEVINKKVNNFKKKNIDKSDTIKKIYRDIAKLSHPDKIIDSSINETYIEATKSYEKQDLIDLIYYAKKLGIEYDRHTLDVDKMKSNIEDMKIKIKSYEVSTHFKWYYSERDENVIKNYIAKQFLTM